MRIRSIKPEFFEDENIAYNEKPQENAQRFFNDAVEAVLAYIGEAEDGFYGELD